MNTKFPWIAILVASAVTIGCGEDDKDDDEDGGSADGGSADGGGGDGGSTDGGGGDGGSGDGGGDITNPYTSYAGWESLDYAGGYLPAGELNCQMVWRFDSTSPVNPMDSACDNCEFMFDVSYNIDNEYTVNDGSCDGLDPSGTYGYSADFKGYGGTWVYDYGGAYYSWGYGDFDGAVFNYWYGYVDYPYSYNGSVYYLTYYQYGLVDVL